MKTNLILLFLILPMHMHAETIDEYVRKAESNRLWGNGACGYVEPVLNFDANKMLKNAFKTVSLNEGKPKKWKILEHKKTKIHGAYYYLISFMAFKNEQMLVFNLNAGDGKWCVR